MMIRSLEMIGVMGKQWNPSGYSNNLSGGSLETELPFENKKTTISDSNKKGMTEIKTEKNKTEHCTQIITNKYKTKC